MMTFVLDSHGVTVVQKSFFLDGKPVPNIPDLGTKKGEDTGGKKSYHAGNQSTIQVDAYG